MRRQGTGSRVALTAASPVASFNCRLPTAAYRLLEAARVDPLDAQADRLAHLLAEARGRFLGALGPVVAHRQRLDVGLRPLLVLPLQLAGAAERHVALTILDADGRARIAMQVPVLHPPARGVHHDRVALE